MYAHVDAEMSGKALPGLALDARVVARIIRH